MFGLKKLGSKIFYIKFELEGSEFHGWSFIILQFDSKVHFPGEYPTRFMISCHTWYAMRIIKPCDQTQLTSVDILNLR